jgi:transposase
MDNSPAHNLTPEARAFLEPRNATHRQYEALRAYFVDGERSVDVAHRFGYTPGSFRVLCHEFRNHLDREFFCAPQAGRQPSEAVDPVHQKMIALRKQNLSIYDIREVLKEEEGIERSPSTIAAVLQEEGFARLPRRRDEERPARVGPEAAEVADVRKLDLGEREFRTKFGGLFLFVPYLAAIPLEELLAEADFPGSAMVPAAHAMRSLLGLKLFGNARHSHVMSHVFDEGLALFTGLNVTPKRAFLTEYSCRIDPRSYPKVMAGWFEAVTRLGLEWGTSFDLDFHTIPFHGEDALVQKHYVSKRSRSQKGILAFLAQDAGTRVFCYAHGEIRREDRDDEILRFVEYWRERTGHYPQELVFDSKLTTYRNLDRLNKLGIDFITLRRRSKKMLVDVARQPLSAWRRIELERVPRTYRHPRVLNQKVQLGHYEGACRQLVVADLGHEQPTFLLTNQMRRSPAKLVGRYAERMVIENGIADGIDFFHMDALSSAVAMKINCDLQLTLMASSLYRLLAAQVGNGYKTAKSSRIFRDLVDAVAQVTLTEQQVVVRFQKRAHNPLLLAAGFGERSPAVPWWGGRRLRLRFR